MDYGKIISFGFTNAWKYKSLWILGFFVSAGGGGNFNLGGGDGKEWDFGGKLAPHYIQRILENPLIIVTIAAIVLALILVFLVLSTISIGGLIEAARRFKQSETYHFGEVFGVGVKFFWRILGITILVIITVFALIIFLVLIGVAAFLIHTVFGFLSLLILIPLFIIGLFLIIATSALAERFVIIKNRLVFDAIGDGFTLWTKNLGSTVLYALIYFGISVGVFLAAMVIILFVAIPFIGIAFVNLLLALLLGIPIVLLALLIVEGLTGSAMHLMTTEFYYQLMARGEGPQSAAAGTGPLPSSPPRTPSTYDPQAPPPPDYPRPTPSRPPTDEPPPPQTLPPEPD